MWEALGGLLRAGLRIVGCAQWLADPFLKMGDSQTAKGVLVTITAGEDLTFAEFDQVAEEIHDAISPDAVAVVGIYVEPEIGEQFMVTVLLTGLSKPS